MTEITSAEKITKARAALICAQPFFGSLALRLTPTVDATCETMWTNGATLGYNPAFVDTLSLDETKGVICHEVMHCATAHQSRRGNREARRWNESGDYAINGILEQARIVLPKSRLLDARFDGMSAEAIYSQLASEDSGNDSGGDANSDSSASGGDPNGNGAQPSSDPNAQPSSDPGGTGEVRDATQPDGAQASQPDMNQSAQDWQIATAQAAQQAKSMGAFPGALERLVDGIVNPLVDWRDALIRFVSQTARNDYRWLPPNRRFVHMGLYLPSCRSEELPPLVVAVDTSGSIDGDTLKQFAAELTAILESYRTSATVIYCDARIKRIAEVSSDDLPLTLEPIGGGGTNFCPVFDHIATLEQAPSCLIYLTDCDGTYPDDSPAYPVLWARYGNSETLPPFGELVSIA